jgi:hypothetical protein
MRMTDLWQMMDAVSASSELQLQQDPAVVEAAESLVEDDEAVSTFVPYDFPGCSPQEKDFLNAYMNSCGDIFDACRRVGINPMEVQVKLTAGDSAFSDWFFRAEEVVAEMTKAVARKEAVKGTKKVIISKGSVSVTHNRDINLLTRLLVAEHPQYADQAQGAKSKLLAGTVAPVLKLSEG